MSIHCHGWVFKFLGRWPRAFLHVWGWDVFDQVLSGIYSTSVCTANDVNTHSLRQGGATGLATMGVPHYVIQCLGRWTFDAYRKYNGLSDEFLTDLQRGMADTRGSVGSAWAQV